MDTLDFLFSLNEQVAEEKKKQAEKVSADKEKEEKAGEVGDEEEEEWHENDKSGKSGKGGSGTKKAEKVSVHEVAAARVDKEDLVWAPCCAWFKNIRGKRFWPAVVRPSSMGAVIPNIEWPITEDKVLVQFICMYKLSDSASASSNYQVIKRVECRAFWEDVTDTSGSSSSKKKQQTTLQFSGKSPQRMERWNVDSFENLKNLIQDKFFIGTSKGLIDKVRARCNEFMRLAHEVVEEEAPDAEVLAARALDQEAQLERDRAESALQAAIRDRGDAHDWDDDAECIIRPGTWLSYQAAMGKHEVYSQVVRVNAREQRPVSLTSDYPLDKNSLVRVMRALPDGACDKLHGTRTRPLREFRLEDGRSKTLRGAAEASERDAIKYGGISSRGDGLPPGPSKAASTRAVEDDEDDEDDEEGSDDEVEILRVTQPRGSKADEGKLVPRKTDSPRKPAEKQSTPRMAASEEDSPKRPPASPSKSESSVSPSRKSAASPSPSPSPSPKRPRVASSPKSSSDIYSSASSQGSASGSQFF